MRRLVLFCFLVSLLAFDVYPQQIYNSCYDYTEHAEKITEGCVTQYEQARNIYVWLCENIAYDTDYTIYNADECYDTRKGVCQAYCELFYHIGKTIGLETTIISGRVKDISGAIDGNKHAWLSVKADGKDILIDPTWGAGYVKGDRFIRNDHDMSWFDIDPYWLIFTHFPNHKDEQFIPQPIKWKQFLQLPPLYPSSTEYGWDGHEMFTQILNGTIQSLPQIFEQYSGYVSLSDIPMQGTLQPGKYYTFTLKKKQANEIILIHGGEFIYEEEWQKDGDEYTLKFMPISEATINLSIAMKTEAGRSYNTVVLYDVSYPTAEDLKNIEKHTPLRMPEVRSLKNMDVKDWAAIEADGQELLKCVRQKKVAAVPVLYKYAPQYIRGAQIPFTETLAIGQTYTFSFIPQGGLEWKISNEKEWFGEWQIDEATGRYTMQVTPKTPGHLRLSVKTKEGKVFDTMVGYLVE